MDATTIGVDLAKTVFELAMANAAWRVIGRRRLTRPQFERFLASESPTRLVMEACGTAHHWARIARAHGHRVTLLPAQYVRAYVRRNKTDRTDAEALIEAVRSGGIDPVTAKTVAQQELQALHRVRAEWMTTRTARINAMRGFLQEHGLTISRGARTALATIPTLLADADAPIPARLRAVLAQLLEDVRAVDAHLGALERDLAAIADADPVVRLLLTIPGIGLITATALVATVGHIHGFRAARRFASWLGLTPSVRSSAHRRRLGAISKMGDVYLRCLLTHGARAVLLAAHRAQGRRRELTRLLSRRGAATTKPRSPSLTNWRASYGPSGAGISRTRIGQPCRPRRNAHGAAQPIAAPHAPLEWGACSAATDCAHQATNDQKNDGRTKTHPRAVLSE